MNFTELFGVANPPPGKTYDFTAAYSWIGTSGRGFGIDWSARGVGFGQVYFAVGPKGELHIDTECMSDLFVTELLAFVVSQATKDNEPKDWKSTNDYWSEGYQSGDDATNPYPEGEHSHVYWQKGQDSK